jgi:hypothetical protein
MARTSAIVGLGFNDWDNMPGPWNAVVGCKEWTAPGALWRASFGPIPFAVETDTKSGGRRVHVHEYPSREWWDNEDLGRLRQQIDVQAFVFGDLCDLWAERLFAVCTSQDVGLLVLPMRVPVFARCLTVESTFNANALGRIDFNMRFSIEANMPHGLVPSQAFNYQSPVQLQGNAESAAKNVVLNARAVFEDEFTGDQEHVARTDAANQMRRVSEAIRKASANARSTAASAKRITFLASFIDTMANDLADSQRTNANTLTARSGVKSQRLTQVGKAGRTTSWYVQGLALRTSTNQVLPAIGNSEEGFGGKLQQAMQELADGAPNPSDLAQALFPLTTINIKALRKSLESVNTKSTKDQLQLAEAVVGLTRRLAMAHTTLASIRVAPERQPDASLTRNRLVTQLDDEISKASSWPDLWVSLRHMRKAVVTFTNYWSRGGSATQDLDPKMGGRPLATIASDFYAGHGSEGRDEELMRLNGVSHPLYPSMNLVALKS